MTKDTNAALREALARQWYRETYGEGFNDNSHEAVAVAAWLAAQEPSAEAGLSEDDWHDLAIRHVTADWNCEEPDGYLKAVKAVIADFLATRPAPAAPATLNGLPFVAGAGSTLARMMSPAPAAPAEALWHDETEVPEKPGWCAVMRADGSLCLRGFGKDGLWWIPLKDGWLSGIPPGFKWAGPFEPIEWDTPQAATPTRDAGVRGGQISEALLAEVLGKLEDDDLVKRVQDEWAREAGSAPADICGNCDSPMPEGCGGVFKDEGHYCRLNAATNTERAKP